jgi:hypothetical protein
MKTKIEKQEDKDISKVPWRNLNSDDRKSRSKAMFAVMMIRLNHESINSPDSWSGLKPEEIIFHAKQAFERKNGKWYVKEEDNIEQLVFFLENHKIVPIIVRNSSDDKLIIDWYVALSNYSDYPDINYLVPFKDKFIEDIYGVKHYFRASNCDMYQLDARLIDNWVNWGFEDIDLN